MSVEILAGNDGAEGSPEKEHNGENGQHARIGPTSVVT